MRLEEGQHTSISTALLALRGIETARVTAQHITRTVAFGAGAFLGTVVAGVDGHLACD